MSDKTESLIVKENEDHTFSGILVQYDLTKEEKQQFLTGQNTEINSKIKIFDVDKLNLNAKTNVDVIGCFVITWETGWCSANVHYTGGPGGCTVGGAPAPMIQSIEYVCENGNPAGNGESGESGSTGPVVGAGIDLGAYFSIPFISIGYQYYETEDDLDPNYLHYMSVVNYFSSLGTTLNQLRTANPDLFYYTFFYFKDNGINPTTKAFISQRLNGLNAWYVAAENSPNSISANNQYFLNWAYKYLILNPDVTWEEFYEEYLATPCDKIKAKFADIKFKEKVTAIDKPEVFADDSEMGYASGYPDASTGATETQYVLMENNPNTHKVKLPDGNQYFAYMHSHTNDTATEITIKIFSPKDVSTFLTSCVRNAEDHGSIKDAYSMVITSEGNYMLQYSGTGDYSIGDNQIKNWENWYLTEFQKIQKEDGSFNQNDVEKLFSRFLKESVKIDGLEVYYVEKNTGKASKLTTNGTKIPCPL